MSTPLGRCVCLQSYTSLAAAAEAVDGSVTSVSDRGAACDMLQRMFDFSLLLSPTFIVICLSGVLPMTGQSGQSSVVSPASIRLAAFTAS